MEGIKAAYFLTFLAFWNFFDSGFLMFTSNIDDLLQGFCFFFAKSIIISSAKCVAYLHL